MSFKYKWLIVFNARIYKVKKVAYLLISSYKTYALLLGQNVKKTHIFMFEKNVCFFPLQSVRIVIIIYTGAF